MPIGVGTALLASGGLSVWGANKQANAAQQAAQLQYQAALQAIAEQKAEFNTIQQQQAPQRQLGYNSINQLGSLGSGAYQTYDANGNPTGTSTGSGYLTHQFGSGDLNAQMAPNYGFVLDQGQRATQNANNVGGGLIGGNALTGLQNYTQGLAGTQYQNAFTNYQNQRNNIYGILAGQAGIGQTAQSAVNTAGQNATNNISSLGVGGASALGQGQIASANAYGGLTNTLGSGATLWALLNQKPNVQAPQGYDPNATIGPNTQSGGVPGAQA